MSASKFEKDLSKGNVAKNLITFALPFLLANLIQTLYNVADMMIVGNFSGTLCMNGVNIGSQITFVITNMVMGLCVGGTVLVAQYLTAGRKKEMKDTIGTLFTSLLVLAVAITVIFLIIQKPILRIFTDDAEVLKHAGDYFFVTMLGTVFIFAYNALSAVMRGMGDSKNPLIFVTISCVTNIVLDILLVYAFDMAALGAAIATVFSQGLSAFLCIIHLKRNNFVFDFRLSSFGFNRQQLKMLLRIGLPTSIQNMATGMSFLFITAIVNAVSPIAGASVGVVSKLNGFAILPAAALSSSVSAVSAQNIGAGELTRAKKTMAIGMLISVCISLVIFVLFQTMPEFFLKLFVSESDPDAGEMIRYGVSYMRTFSIDYLIVPFLFSFNGLFIGSGHTMFTLFNNAVSAVILRVPFSYFGGKLIADTLMGIGIGAPAASSFSLLMCIGFFVAGKWKKMTIINDDNPAYDSET